MCWIVFSADSIAPVRRVTFSTTGGGSVAGLAGSGFASAGADCGWDWGSAGGGAWAAAGASHAIATRNAARRTERGRQRYAWFIR